MSLEHKAKLKAGRDKYLAERKAFQANDGTPTVIPGGNRLQKINLPPRANSSHRDYTVNKIALRRGLLVDSQLDIAIGYHYIDEKGDKIYTKGPDASTGQYLLNQLIGKPKESIEIKEEFRLNVDI